MKKSFDNDKYLQMQSEKIRERIKQFDNKLYLEFGGKLFDDEHASRVLPGFEPDSKLKMLLKLKDQIEIVIVVNALDIESKKIRGDFDIGYDSETLRLIDSFTSKDMYVSSVVINQYEDQKSVRKFQEYLEKMGITVYHSYTIDGYPTNVSYIVSDEGFGKNDYIETTRPLVVVTAPGPGSGKLSICMSQMYHDYKLGINAGYAKFETFPVWNLPLKHPVNIAYEAATADLNDMNIIDPFHLEAYNITTSSYNRDVEAYPILKSMFEKIMGYSPYKSPTDMGVNMVGFCISNEDGVKEACEQEVIRRYYDALNDLKRGKINEYVVDKLDSLMSQMGISSNDRKVILAAQEKHESSGRDAFAIELESEEIITGRTTDLLNAPSACLLNTLKYLGNINDEIPLISPHILEPINNLKNDVLKERQSSLHLDEVLIALAMSATTNPVSQHAMMQLEKLKDLEAHSTVMLSSNDRSVLRKLGIRFTSSPQFRDKGLFRNY